MVVAVGDLAAVVVEPHEVMRQALVFIACACACGTLESYLILSEQENVSLDVLQLDVYGLHS